MFKRRIKYVNKKIFYIPNPSDTSIDILKVDQISNNIFDMFIGLSHGQHRATLKKFYKDEREDFIINLQEKLPDIIFDNYGIANNQPVWGDQYYKRLSQSKMALNLSRGLPFKWYSSDRISSFIPNGITTFIDRATKLDDFFSEDEVVFYKNINDLAESINYLKQFNPDVVKLLEGMLSSEEKLNPLYEESIEYKLDQLVFNENLSLKDKATFKVKLTKQITNRSTEKINHEEAFNTLHDKINENVSKLNENQIEILNLFIENDSQKINDYYTNLINEVTDIVENNIVATDNGEVIKRLVEVKKKLNTLKTQKPNIDEVEKIISLKESFS